MTDPQTPEEWQEAAAGAYFYLLIDSAKQYGLIKGGPNVNVERAMEIVERAEAMGIVPVLKRESAPQTPD